MWRSMFLAVLAGLCLAGPARAYEYALQYTPNAGARGLTVAGYGFGANGVIGNCSYYIETSGSGRGGGYHNVKTYYNQTCGWDLYGNLLSVAQGAPTAPAPLSTAGGLIVYAQNVQGDTTGVDTAQGNIGFVNTLSAQYAWSTQPTTMFLPNQKPVTIKLTLRSEGDFPLVVTKINPAAQLSRASVRWTTCMKAPVKPGASCAALITYDPRGLPLGDDPYTAYDTLTVGIVSNSGQAPDFSESIEVSVAPGG
jgi:hypothetical protein